MEDPSPPVARRLNPCGPDRRQILLAGSALLAAAVAGGAAEAAEAAGARPNIIYIIADDQGWKDVGFHGSDIKTPNLDALARTGAELTSFYVQPMCTPTRAAFMTGRYPLRYGLQTAVIPTGGRYGLPTDEKLLPQALKEAGYATAMVGKWHLGHADRKYWPNQRGFDRFYGPLVGELDHFTHQSNGQNDWYHDNQNVDEPGYDTTLFGNEAVRIIEAQDRKQPLFLYLAFTAPHAPFQAPEEYLARFPNITDPQRRIYAAMISAMDDQIGRVVAALEAKGMRDNTLIVFHGDNGGTRSKQFSGQSKIKGELPPNNGPYRDGKGTVYEGGTRVLALANWPGRIKPGKANGIMHVVDMYPTLTALAGGGAAPGKPLDGLNVWNAISQGEASPRTEVVYNVDPFVAGVRQGDWKVVWTAILPGKVELFNLAQDPSETRDLAADEPARTKALQDRITELAKQMAPPLLLPDVIRTTLSEPYAQPIDILEASE
jgi:arylsulfatase A-like enzyme